MNRFCFALLCGILVAFSAMMSPASGNSSDEYQDMADRLAESPRFRSWIAAVASYQGWRVPEHRKANRNRVRVYGVCWTPEAVVVAFPEQALTVEGQPLVQQVYLEPGEDEMRPIIVEAFPHENVKFWIWCGNTPDDRFQFSLDLSQGPPRWG